MREIILIATGHNEHGLCNSNELFKIIEAIAPDVIFEEIPPNRFSAIYDGKTFDSLETASIKKYLQKHSVPHVPVDMVIEETTDRHFRNEIRRVWDTVDYYSSDCVSLFNEHVGNVNRLGFPYLNSDECGLLLERQNLLIGQILQKLNERSLLKLYINWRQFIDGRENEMLRNIYSYSDVNEYNRAVFLVGAEHRRPLIDKIKALEMIARPKLDWIFDQL